MIVSLVISGVCLVRQNGRDAVFEGAGRLQFYLLSPAFNVEQAAGLKCWIWHASRGSHRAGCGPHFDVDHGAGLRQNSLLTALIASYLLRLSENLKDVNAAMFSRARGDRRCAFAIGAAEAAEPLPRRSWTRSSILRPRLSPTRWNGSNCRACRPPGLRPRWGYFNPIPSYYLQ